MAVSGVGACVEERGGCANSGSLAQVRFGARSGAAPVFLGLVKLVLGLAFGGSLFQLLRAFPSRLLGSLMIFSGTPGPTCDPSWLRVLP